MAPSQISIATSSLNRLIKEEASYHKELTQQEARLTKLESGPDEEGNKDFLIRQEKTAIEETKRMFPRLESDIATGRQRLLDVMKAGGGSEEEIAKAQEALKAGKA
ncbi:MAG: hypothetical protein GOMPHAMPRED_002939 [Gomphillus americanus]|uniref:Tubulin-specific chaperone A n=1 Tax=Gomphillus americanus TaxID=1940652 RepID=A0A8H3EDY2_9LECA|nr:MAG: hypothetical protein GOMPHAMPRED_002939 [Gomphillus americanus]